MSAPSALESTYKQGPRLSSVADCWFSIKNSSIWHKERITGSVTLNWLASKGYSVSINLNNKHAGRGARHYGFEPFILNAGCIWTVKNGILKSCHYILNDKEIVPCLQENSDITWKIKLHWALINQAGGLNGRSWARTERSGDCTHHRGQNSSIQTD